MSRRRALLVIPLAVLVAALVGCTESARIPPPEPTSGTQPLFATDEEALEAATQAYEEFLLVSGQILRDGGANPERLVPLVSDEVYISELEGFATLAQNGWRATGESALIGAELQQHLAGPPGSAEVIAYVCISVAENDIVDQGGVSQISENRDTSIAFEVVYESTVEGALVIDRKTLWPETVSCSQN